MFFHPKSQNMAAKLAGMTKRMPDFTKLRNWPVNVGINMVSAPKYQDSIKLPSNRRSARRGAGFRVKNAFFMPHRRPSTFTPLFVSALLSKRSTTGRRK